MFFILCEFIVSLKLRNVYFPAQGIFVVRLTVTIKYIAWTCCSEIVVCHVVGVEVIAADTPWMAHLDDGQSRDTDVS
jgi:hypothetical protein